MLARFLFIHFYRRCSSAIKEDEIRPPRNRNGLIIVYK